MEPSSDARRSTIEPAPLLSDTHAPLRSPRSPAVPDLSPSFEIACRARVVRRRPPSPAFRPPSTQLIQCCPRPCGYARCGGGRVRPARPQGDDGRCTCPGARTDQGTAPGEHWRRPVCARGAQDVRPFLSVSTSSPLTCHQDNTRCLHRRESASGPTDARCQRLAGERTAVRATSSRSQRGQRATVCATCGRRSRTQGATQRAGLEPTGRAIRTTRAGASGRAGC